MVAFLEVAGACLAAVTPVLVPRLLWGRDQYRRLAFLTFMESGHGTRPI